MSRRAQALPWLVLMAGLLAYPHLVNDFWLQQVAGRTLGFGTIVLSLTFLAAFAGMLSLAQMTLAGIAGYALAYFSAPVAGVGIDLGQPAAILIALAGATLAGALVGLVAMRTEGIYTLMITLAIGMAFYYLTLQNYTVFNGFTGFAKVAPPVLGVLDLGRPLPFYHLALAVAALFYLGVRHLLRTPLGLAIQANRDNPRRLQALGYDIGAIKVATFAMAGLMAGAGGIMNVWLNRSISPGSVAVVPIIDVLMAAVLGGINSPLGAFVGAFAFTLIQSFAIELVDRDRFNTVIGLVFLLIVLFSPDGLVGLWRRLAGLGRHRDQAARTRPSSASTKSSPVSEIMIRKGKV